MSRWMQRRRRYEKKRNALVLLTLSGRFAQPTWRSHILANGELRSRAISPATLFQRPSHPYGQWTSETWFFERRDDQTPPPLKGRPSLCGRWAKIPFPRLPGEITSPNAQLSALIFVNL